MPNYDVSTRTTSVEGQDIFIGHVFISGQVFNGDPQTEMLQLDPSDFEDLYLY